MSSPSVITTVEPTGSPDPTAGGHRAPRRRGRVLRAVIGGLATILVASFVVFVALSFAPGDPVAQLLGSKATPEARDAMRQELGLDDHVLIRYGRWLGDAVQGDLGSSVSHHGESVSSLIGPRVEVTLELVVLSALLVIVVGIGLGILGGVSTRLRGVVSVLAGLGVAIPAMVAATLAIALFSVKLGWFPTYGAGERGLDRLHHLILPAISLSMLYGAYVTQMTSAAVREESTKGWVVTNRGRGISGGRIIRRHIVRNAALPVITSSGLAVAGLFSGTLVVEKAFGIEGIGSLLVDSIASKDYSVVTATSMIIVIAFVVIMTTIDLLQDVLDPLSRQEGT